MPRIASVQAIGIKTESTQGSAVALSATDFILAHDVTVTPEVEVIERDNKRSSLDTVAHVKGQRYFMASFKTELKGSGAAGTAYAPLGAAIQACGFTETVSGGVSVTYAPTSVAASASYYGPGKSCTIKFYDGQKIFSLAGCQGNMKIVAEKAGSIVILEFEMRGTYTTVADGSIPAQTYLATMPPILASSNIEIHGVTSAILSSVTIDCGNTVAMREDAKSAAGVKGFVVTRRKPTFQMQLEDELVATHDFYGKLMSASEGQMSMSVGSAAGNTTAMTLPKMQFNVVKAAEKDGLGKVDITGQFNQTSGDDWISFLQT